MHASRGWAVFPAGTPRWDHRHAPGSDPDCTACKAEKAPRPGWKWKERHSANPAVIRPHWPADDPNIGVACGPSRLVVVDLDTPAHGAAMPQTWASISGIREGADVLAHLAEQAGQPYPFQTYTVRTASAGWHLYFQALDGRPVPNSAGKVGPMIDVRGGVNADGTAGGGYVLGAGSLVGGASYQVINDADPLPLPGWIADLAAPRAAAPAVLGHRQVPGAEAAGAAGDVRPRGRIVGLLDTVLTAPNGQRNNVLHWAACRAGEMIRDGHLDRHAAYAALAQAGESIGLGTNEVQATLNSAFNSAFGTASGRTA